MSKVKGKPKVYSYVRFSTMAQEEGDSVRRQIAAHRQWAERHGLPLDESLKVDRGLSGYTGENIDKGSLGQFVRLVASGAVPSGSYLLVDTLDRITRDDEQTALYLLLTLTRAGVRIVRLNPSELVFDETSDLGTFLAVLVDVSRAHGESATKSSLISRAKAQQRDAARAGEKIRQRIPGWLRWEDGRYLERPERAEVVRRAWRLKAEGMSYVGIAEVFNAEGIPTWGKASRWTQSAIHGMFNRRQALGRWQPRLADGTAVGPPIEDHYPVIVPEAIAARALTVLGERNHLKGRARKCVSLFAGILFEACTENGALIARPQPRTRTRTSQHAGKMWYALQRHPELEGPRPIQSLPYDHFEVAILSRLVELRAAELKREEASDESAISLRLAEALERQEFLKKALKRPTESLVEAARAVDDEVLSLRDELEQAQRSRYISTPDDLTACQELIRSLRDASDGARLKALRVRIRSLILSIVERIDVVIVKRGIVRLAAVQVRFKGGTRREYLLAFRREQKHRNGEEVVATMAVKSLHSGAIGEDESVDLTNAEDVAILRAELEEMELTALEMRPVEDFSG